MERTNVITVCCKNKATITGRKHCHCALLYLVCGGIGASYTCGLTVFGYPSPADTKWVSPKVYTCSFCGCKQFYKPADANTQR